MENPTKILLPPPNFDKKSIKDVGRSKVHYLTPSGMTLLPREKQPPPMYGKRGTTVPSKFLQTSNEKHGIKMSQAEMQPPTEEKQYCEPCEMELQSKDDLRRHRAQHERCPVDGCNFRGHFSIMDKHVATLHATGLFDKVKKLSTPEEIAAWRNERRKKYPTLANVLMRQRAQEQRQKRGERLEANKSRFGKRDDRKRTQGRDANNDVNKVTDKTAEKMPEVQRNTKNQKRNNKRRKMHEKHEQQDKERLKKLKQETVAVETNVDAVLQCGGVWMFKGTSQLKDYKHAKTQQVTTNALTSLLGMYGSDEDISTEDEVEENMEQTIQAKVEEDLQKIEVVLVDAECSKEIADNLEGLAKLECNNINSALKMDEITNDENLFIAEEHIETKETASNSITCVQTEDNVTITAEKSANDSSDEAPEEMPIAHISDLPVCAISTSQSVVVNDATSTQSQRSLPNTKNALKPVRRSQPKRSGLDYRKARLRKQNTMLEKLLETDIRHERNVLLQCIRFVCENNYFGIGRGAAATYPSVNEANSEHN